MHGSLFDVDVTAAPNKLGKETGHEIWVTVDSSNCLVAKAKNGTAAGIEWLSVLGLMGEDPRKPVMMTLVVQTVAAIRAAAAFLARKHSHDRTQQLQFAAMTGLEAEVLVDATASTKDKLSIDVDDLWKELRKAFRTRDDYCQFVAKEKTWFVAVFNRLLTNDKRTNDKRMKNPRPPTENPAASLPEIDVEAAVVVPKKTRGPASKKHRGGDFEFPDAPVVAAAAPVVAAAAPVVAAADFCDYVRQLFRHIDSIESRAAFVPITAAYAEFVAAVDGVARQNGGVLTCKK
jgi:hypothetical protein